MPCRCAALARVIRCGMVILAVLPACLASGAALQGTAVTSDELERGFENPPLSARPRVWWHWVDGNVTLHGIEQDLAWMSRVGLGGVQMFDASLGGHSLVPEPLVFGTSAWSSAVGRAIALAHESH